MRYFTKQLWIDAQRPGKDTDEQWTKAFKSYQAQLKKLRGRVDADAFEFFTSANVHDGELMWFHVVDGSRPAPLGRASRRWRSSDAHPISVEVAVLDAPDTTVWTLKYQGVRRILLDFPSEEPLFHFEGRGFSDWGYHELTSAGKEFLRHEVLFSSGASILIEFKQATVKARKRTAKTRKT